MKTRHEMIIISGLLERFLDCMGADARLLIVSCDNVATVVETWVDSTGCSVADLSTVE